MPRRPLSMFAVCLLAAVGSIAAEGPPEAFNLSLDPEATKVTFELGATGHTVQGDLYARGGELHLTQNGGASGYFELDALRTSTHNKRRDKTMHNKVLESSHFPTIRFEAESFKGSFPTSGEGSLSLVGSIILLGQSHPFELPIHWTVEGDRFTGSTDIEVPFIDWGLHDPSLLFLRVHKTVDIHIETSGPWDPASAPSGEEIPSSAQANP